MIKEPDRLNIDGDDDRKRYEALKSEDFFANMDNKDRFMLAMAVGFDSGLKQPLSKREGFFLAKDLQKEDEALLGAIAIKDFGNIDVLKEKASIYRIAEEYAHAGLKILYDKILSQKGSINKLIEKEIYDAKERNKKH